ncbi:peptide deformylase [Ferrovum sp. PN-J185]|uniref:peptide deformylase n=1 Tax=Ferrovum sp. PN-J185 TaxID=1356306 RepID=UPI00079B104D|nr:peptide deformylase [Ferrovum sp. PN-J185]KXW56299.1 peptide deformylase [Ferrovum sp. PN-J185]MCC6069023.1 peptide deformylase [Ferrovum sp. PN-J185]MDE1890997.1 peptide deformylase [Betaproteobacteria bacterium]MDE2055691.1 peptide deformylase [Betaproteobacteria bacterium]
MAIKPVLRMGHPLLRQVAKSVDQFNTPALMSLLEDMFDTMAYLDGAGLAAPQIGVSLRVVIFGVKHNARYPDAEEVPLTVLINPIITPLTEELEEDWEGCLSVPGLRGRVPRYTVIRYQGSDEHGNIIDRTVSGFHARVVQHECDHLDGVLYPSRIRDFNSFGFSQELGINTPDD